MSYDELLQSLGEKLGGIELTPDESGKVTLAIDDMRLTLANRREHNAVEFSAPVGGLPSEDRTERLYKALLRANHNFIGTAGATLAIDSSSHQITLCQDVSIFAASDDDVLYAIEVFVNVLESWRRLVSEYANAELPEEEDFASSPFGGFMQV